GFAEDFFGGAWLKLGGLEQLTNMMEGMAGVETPEPSELESLREEISDAIDQFLDEVPVQYVGSEDPGEHVTVTATAQQAGEFFVGVMEPLSGMLPAQPGVAPGDLVGELRRELQSVPDLEIPIEFWLDGGTVSRVGFDVVSFARRNPDLDEDMEIPSGIDRLLIVADLSEFGGGIDTPDDVIEVDLFELFGRFMGQGFEMDSEASGSSVSVTESATVTATESDDGAGANEP
ncbi:MAG: hypothetical protein R3324_17135, partial [Halobacteriales archaeon]|nr:hypothetical protein [Halobacteriales archaeon]